MIHPAAPLLTDPSLADRVRRLRLIAFDFDGVFTDNRVYVFEDGKEAVACSRADGIGLRAVERQGIATAIVSTETNPVVSARAKKLKIECVQSCEDKVAAVELIAERMGIGLDEVAFVGNDVNDLAVLRRVGLPIVVRDAHPAVRDVGAYRTDALGGYGAVREVCDLVCEIRAGAPA